MFRSSDERIERENALVIDHGSTVQTSGIWQLIDESNFAIGNCYILSANVRMDNGTSQLTESVQLELRFHDEPALDQLLVWSPGLNRNWRKLVRRIQVPSVPPASSPSIRVTLRAVNASGKTWFDFIQLAPSTPVLQGPTDDGQNMVANGCFDAPSLAPWSSNCQGVELDSTDSFCGNNSLRIQGSSGQYRTAAQTIDLNNRGFETDSPIYTVAAHIKTLFSETPPPVVINTDYWDRTPVNPDLGESPDPTLPDVPTRGASITVHCYDGNVFLRTLNMPFLVANYGEFVERKFSFLVPEGTTAIQLCPTVNDSDMTAWFDNLRLVKNNPVGPALVSQVGPSFGVVEAPELGTSVKSDDYANIQDAIEDVSNPASSNYGRMVWVPPIDHFDNLRRIFLRTGLHLKMHKDAQFFRSHEDPAVNDGLYSSQWHGAFIKNDDLYTPISDVIVEGGNFYNDAIENAQGLSFTGGSVIANCCDRYVIRNIHVGAHGVPDGIHARDAATVFYLLGHDIYVHNNRIANPAGFMGKDGVHLWGGGRLHVMSNDFETGDDALAVASSPDSILFQGFRPQVILNRNLEDVEIFNNLLTSHNARVLHTGLANSVVPAEGPHARMTNTIKNIRFRNFVGQCGGRNQMINIVSVPAPTTADEEDWWPFPEDGFVASQVRNVSVSNGDLQGSDQLYLTLRRPPIGIRIRTDDVGSVCDVRFDNVQVRNVAAEVDGNTILQKSKIFAVEKRVWYGTPMERIELVGHDNRMISCTNCIFDAISIDGNNQPDGGINADFLFSIDGRMDLEVNDVEDFAYNNLLNFHSPSDADPGLRQWNEFRHTGRPPVVGEVSQDGVLVVNGTIFDDVILVEKNGTQTTITYNGCTEIFSKLNGVTINALSGNDQIFADFQDIVIFGGDGNDEVTITGFGRSKVHGEGGDDVIVGGFGADELFGGEGNDDISGRNGSDLIYGGAPAAPNPGTNTLRGGPGADIILGGAAVDIIIGGAGNDTICGFAGNDDISGNQGADLISGGAGNDLISGGLGFDTVMGGPGDDNISGGDGQDLLQGGQGNDTLNGNLRNDILHGNGGDDILTGGPGNDELHGGPGNDAATDNGEAGETGIENGP